MTARKASPAIMKCMVVCFGAGVDGDEGMLGGTDFRLAASDQVRSRSSDCILDHVRKKRSQHDTDSKTKYCNIRLV